VFCVYRKEVKHTVEVSTDSVYETDALALRIYADEMTDFAYSRP